MLGNNKDKPNPVVVVMGEKVNHCKSRVVSHISKGGTLVVTTGIRIEADKGNVRHHRNEPHDVKNGEPGS